MSDPYAWIVEDEVRTGSLEDYANDRRHGHDEGLLVSPLSLLRFRLGGLACVEADVAETAQDRDDDTRTVTLHVNDTGDEASFTVDLRA